VINQVIPIKETLAFYSFARSLIQINSSFKVKINLIAYYSGNVRSFSTPIDALVLSNVVGTRLQLKKELASRHRHKKFVNSRASNNLLLFCLAIYIPIQFPVLKLSGADKTFGKLGFSAS
jgi:hypothetical protein